MIPRTSGNYPLGGETLSLSPTMGNKGTSGKTYLDKPLKVATLYE